jgi:hypothetical protein
MQRIVPNGVVTADVFPLAPDSLAELKQVPEYFYSEFVPKDDSPPFPLLPTYEPPPESPLFPLLPGAPTPSTPLTQPGAAPAGAPAPPRPSPFPQVSD